MRTMTVDRLSVPGAELHYEVRGRGPALLMIAGGPTDGSIFTELADHLMDRYTVITYDPRGNSRSVVEGGPRDIRIEVHGDDAARLIAAVDEGPAYVFGNSGGAIYGLELTAHYPDHVRTFVAHEPPSTALLADGRGRRRVNEKVNAAYVSYGLQTAMELFDEATASGNSAGGDALRAPTAQMAETFNRIDKNMDLFFRVMIPQVCRYVPAIDVLRRGKARVIVGGGDASGDQVPYRAACALARRLGTSVVHFPGDHDGFTTHAVAFADRLHEVFVDSGR